MKPPAHCIAQLIILTLQTMDVSMDTRSPLQPWKKPHIYIHEWDDWPSRVNSMPGQAHKRCDPIARHEWWSGNRQDWCQMSHRPDTMQRAQSCNHLSLFCLRQEEDFGFETHKPKLGNGTRWIMLLSNRRTTRTFASSTPWQQPITDHCQIHSFFPSTWPQINSSVAIRASMLKES